MQRIPPIIGHVSAHLYEFKPFETRARSIEPVGVPFVTISREAWAGGSTIMRQLVAALGAVDPGTPAWTGLDRELVERVADDHDLSADLITHVEDQPDSWLTEVLRGMRYHQQPSDAKVYRRVAQTIRGLAQVGRVVIVGRGGFLVTEDMPGGIHLRLVAPFAFRAERLAEAEGLSTHEAERRVRVLDEGRAAFYKKFWSGKGPTPERFTATFNTATTSPEMMTQFTVDQVKQLLHAQKPTLTAMG